MRKGPLAQHLGWCKATTRYQLEKLQMIYTTRAPGRQTSFSRMDVSRCCNWPYSRILQAIKDYNFSWTAKLLFLKWNLTWKHASTLARNIEMHVYLWCAIHKYPFQSKYLDFLPLPQAISKNQMAFGLVPRLSQNACAKNCNLVQHIEY